METRLNEIIYSHIVMGLTGNGNRSSDRTDVLNTGILSIIRRNVIDFDKKYNVFYEKSIPCAYGNKFKIDILIEDKEGNIITCILLKAFISSVQKNRANNANTTHGEIFRIKAVCGRKNVKVWFISLIANSTPSYTASGLLRNMENVKSSYVDLSKLKSQKNIYHSTIKYDLKNINYSTKDTFKDTFHIDNIDNITENTLIDNAKRILQY
jgi:hypothetical protein